MTKAELLADIQSKSWCAKISVPEVLETKPDGTTWYSANVREQSNGVGGYKNIHFYVSEEGTANESAYYKDTEPVESVSRKATTKKWILKKIDTEPAKYKGVQILWISERWEMVIYSILENVPLEQKTYFVLKAEDKPIEIINFDINLIRSNFSE